MKRREFIKASGTGLILSVTPIQLFESAAMANSYEEDIAELERKDSSKNCQSGDTGARNRRIAEVNPNGLSGCKSPHKHVLFIPNEFLTNPSLIELQADAEVNGVKAKIFTTSRANELLIKRDLFLAD